MNDERNEVPLFSELLRSFGTIYTMSILAISFVVLIVIRYTPDVQNVSSLFASGGIGLSFGTIFQLAGFSLILSFFKVLLFSESFFVKMRFLWRTFFLLLATLIVFSVFSIIFNWFPVNDSRSWIGFIVSTLICFSVGFGLTLLKLTLEGKKYNRLLAKYKASRKTVKTD